MEEAQNTSCEAIEATLAVFDYFHAKYGTKIGIITLYVIVLTVGALGNLMVMMAVARNPVMRIPRNLFIVNLALSDFLLCIITVPFNMKLILNTFWDLGTVACKLVATAQAVNIFVSTMSIAAIGFDRYLVIIFPTKTMQQRMVVPAIFISVWLISIILASPYFFASGTGTVFSNETLPEYFIRKGEECDLIDRYLVCREMDSAWEYMPVGKKVYTVACFAFQYVLPLCALTFVYTKIAGRMKARLVSGPAARSASQSRRRSVIDRQKRTNILLIALVVLFAVSWMPFNIFNTLQTFEVIEYSLEVFAFCHITAMTSSCANPILYGVFNDNFRSEFQIIFEKLGLLPLCRLLRRIFCCCCCKRRRGDYEQCNQETLILPALTTSATHEGVNCDRPLLPSEINEKSSYY